MDDKIATAAEAAEAEVLPKLREIHADPDATNGDANGDGSTSTTQDEFVELVNVTGSPVDISGIRLRAAPSRSCTVFIAGLERPPRWRARWKGRHHLSVLNSTHLNGGCLRR